MDELRLSFRLRELEEETWKRLRDRHRGAKDKFIMDELLRRERIRLDNRETHGDMLADIRKQVADVSTSDLRDILLKIVSLLEDDHV